MNIYSDGTDDLAHFRKHASPVAPAAFDGSWCTVEWQPDAFSPQRFCIGVLVGNSQSFEFKLVSDGGKFECVYGKGFGFNVREVVEAAEFELTRMRSLGFRRDVSLEHAALCVSERWPTSGRSVEGVLSRLFNEVVAMEPAVDRQSSEFQTLDTEQVRRMVNDELKRIGHLKFEQIVVNPRHAVRLPADLRDHYLDFNLKTASQVGSVLSAVYKTPHIVELNLLKAGRDIRTYSEIEKINDFALFVMSASEGQLGDSYSQISDLIDAQTWCLEKQGFRVVCFEEPAPLAKEILEWAKL
jgi:hypothetical protein